MLAIILNFISRKVFLNALGNTVMGLNSLLLSVLSMLSLLELGVGNAIYFSLYKPLAENDTFKINLIMRMYAKIYRVIGCLVFIVGIALAAFLYLFIHTELSDRFLYVSYFIMLTDTSLSYYMAYRRNIFNADQRESFNTNVDMIVNMAVSCTQMLIVVLTRNYFVFLSIRMLGTVIGNLYIYYKSNQYYPYLKKKVVENVLPNDFLSSFKENVKALFISNISSYLVSGTDNLFLSRYINLETVFIYSNYKVILNAINQIFFALFNAMQASVGNFMVLETKGKVYELFKKVFFMNFLIVSYTSVALVTLFNDAITLWIGKEYTWPVMIVIVLVFNNYSDYILRAVATFKSAAGLYSPFPAFKYFTLLEGIINIVASLFFVLICRLGVLGVFLGTSVSSLVNTITIPYVLYKYEFKCSAKDYVQKYCQYIALTVAFCILSFSLYQWLCTDCIIINLAIGLIISFCIPTGLSSLIYCKTDEFLFVKGLVEKYLKSLYKRSFVKNKAE